MYTVFLAGSIASGKSTVAAELERLGAWRVDLDQISREVLEPGTPTTYAVAEAFGQDLLDPETGELNRRLLAARAFATREDAQRLEELELPAIRARLGEVLTSSVCGAWEPACCVVEIPLIGRGMTAEDFDARAANQPTDEWLLSHADTVISNEGSLDDLLAQVQAWWDAHERAGWRSRCDGGVAHGA